MYLLCYDSCAPAVHQRSMPRCLFLLQPDLEQEVHGTTWFWPSVWSWTQLNHSYPQTHEQEMHVVIISAEGLGCSSPQQKLICVGRDHVSSELNPSPSLMIKRTAVSHHIFKAGYFWEVNDFIAPMRKLPGIKGSLDVGTRCSWSWPTCQRGERIRSLGYQGTG